MSEHITFYCHARPEHKTFRFNSPTALSTAQGNNVMDDDIYHSGKKLGTRLKKLKSEKSEDAKLLLEFAELLMSQRLSHNRVQKYISHLYTMRKHMDRNFSEAGIKDIRKLVAWISSEDYTPNTKKDMLVALKRFYT